MKTSIRLFLTGVGFLCLSAIGPRAQAVVPAPDGGYPGGNTAEGQNALFSLTTGGFNAAVGYLSLRSDIAGSFNTAIGAGTLLANTADYNTATGAGALLSNNTGALNTANGTLALFSNTTGDSNTATGAQALFNNTTGGQNTAVGSTALFHNTTGGDNTAIGLGALSSNDTGTANTAVGVNALASNLNNANTAIGQGALNLNTTGSGNTALGSGAGINVTTANNVIVIGAAGNNVDDSCFIGNIFGATSSGGIGVFVNSNGRLGTATSSQRFKKDIKSMDRASEALFSLRPVTFHYKKEIDAIGTSQFGLVAEDVEKVNPDLVARDKEGKPYSVRYEQVNAMLLNEFLKEHRKVGEQDRKIQEQEATIAQLKSTVTQQQKGMEVVTRRLEEQAAQIQKVSAQVELSKPAAQTVSNDR